MGKIDEPRYNTNECYPENIKQEDLLVFNDKSDPFHLKQYGEYIPRAIMCKKCGNNQFTVAQESYYTSIRCENCKWEICIHEG